jgi:hypothetical protein
MPIHKSWKGGEKNIAHLVFFSACRYMLIVFVPTSIYNRKLMFAWLPSTQELFIPAVAIKELES